MPHLDNWRLRGQTLQAMLLLCVAHGMVNLLPFRYWRGALGRPVANDAVVATATGSAGPARRLAVHVERGARRLPFATKCLPQAMALCWLLRARKVAYAIKIAARPSATRTAGQGNDTDTLHAWVESGGAIVIGALPGPWLVVLVLHG